MVSAAGETSAVDTALAANYDRLGPGQKRVVDWLMQDVRLAAAISPRQLAAEVGVSEATVTRAAQALGFAGYADLQARMRETYIWFARERNVASPAEFDGTPEAAAIRVMEQDVADLQATMEDLRPDTLRAAAERLIAARRVFVFGSRGSHGLALILGIRLLPLLSDVRILSETAGYLPDQLVDLEADDAVVAISFPLLDHVAIDILRHAAAMEATRIAITDNRANPLARLADIPLIARSQALWNLPSYTPAAGLINALSTVIALRTYDADSPRLRRLRRLLTDFRIAGEG